MTVSVYVITKSSSVCTTTLHSLMLIHSFCMNNNMQLSINFHTDRSQIQKNIKASDRFVFIDYGCSVGGETIRKMLSEFPEGAKALVLPTVMEGVDWALFKKKTLDKSTEPINQRGLRFNLTVSSKEFSPGVHEYLDHVQDARVYVLDSKALIKKLREDDTKITEDTVILAKLKKLKLKIGVLVQDEVVCHYSYECPGNILESMGVHAGP